MFERINGKLYKLVDEIEVAKYAPLLDKVKSYQEGIATCDKSIAAFEEQKKKYLVEIDKVFEQVNLTKEELSELLEQKNDKLGF